MKKTLIVVTLLFLNTSSVFAQQAPGSHFLENWDLNEDGIVSLEDAIERRGDIFDVFDTDDNGALSAEEYNVFDATRAEDMKQNAGGVKHGKGPMQRAQKGLKMTFNDIDGDGLVTKDEFVGRTKAWVEILDRNGDGVVNKEDFGPQMP